MKKTYLQLGNLAAFAAVVVINIMATMGVIGGVATRDVSYMYHSLLTPADYAFSIWGLIYVLLAVIVFRQMNNNRISDQLGYLFLISCVLNVGWIFAWQYKSIALSFILIAALLIDLILLMKETKDSDLFTNMAVGLYTGWINVAMLANLGALFARYNWNWLGTGGVFWAIIGLVFGILWVAFFIIKYYNPYYALGAFWGYLGIVMASRVMSIMIMGIIGMILLTGSAIFVIMRKKMLTM